MTPTATATALSDLPAPLPQAPQKRAFITGITGQDGAYLAQLLLEKGYEVHGGLRRNAQAERARLETLGIADRVILHDLDLSEMTNIFRILRTQFEDLFLIAGFAHRLFRPAGANDINGTIAGDGCHPGDWTALHRVIASGFLPDLQINVLQDIFRFLPVLQDTQDNAKQFRRRTLIKFPKGVAVSCRSCIKQPL